MRIIEQLVYKITGDNSEFDKSITQSETKVSKFGSVADKMLAGVTVAAIGMVVKKMGDMVISSANALDRVDKLSQKIGLSRVAFQEWDYILGQSGASVEGLQMGIKTLSNAAEEARKGTALYAESFDRLGVSVVDVNGNMKDQETLFAEVFSALADMENQTERTALASDLLGRSATELAPTLNTSKEGIEALRQEAHDLGLVYSDELVDAGVVLGDNIDRLKKSFDALKTKALAPIIGLAVTFTDKLFKQKTATSEMAGVLDTIKTKTAEYKSISDQLVNTQNNLSDAERNLLLTRKETLAFEIQKQLVSLASSYNETKDNITTLEGEINNLNRLFDGQNAYLKTLTVGTTEYDNAQKGLERIYGELIGKQQELSNAQISYNGLITEASKLVADGVLDIEKLADVNSELYDKIMAGAEAYKIKKQAETDAIKSLGDLSKASEDEIRALIAETKMMLQGSQSAYDKAYYTKQLEIATKALTGATEDNVDALEEQTNAINEMARTRMSDHEKALAEINEQAAAWIQAGVDETEVAKWVSEQKQKLEEEETKKLEEEEEARKKARENAYAEIERSRMDEYQLALDNIEKQTQAYITAGVLEVDAEKWKAEQIQKYQDEQTKKAQEELDKRNQAVADAYKLLESYSLSEKDKAIANIQAQADAFLKAGVLEVDAEAWKNKELAKLQEKQADKAEEEAERTRKAWEDATFSMLSSVTSIWGSINQVQANENEKEIQRIEKQNAIAIQAAKDRGDSEEEVTELEKTLQADLNNAKNQFAKEEAERNKALSTLSVIVDTAKAIMQIWANPLIAPWGKGVWTGLATAAGAAQIAAINSAPVPSYDVGSIRIPETTQAVVHKDEMILTAPQAEQARREGITIAPNKASGNSVNLVIYLDGKEIARNTIDNLNSGSVGTIKARVVK